MLQLKPSLNISIDNEYAFKCACDNGHIEVVNFLLEKKPTIDISIDGEYCFKAACENGSI